MGKPHSEALKGPVMKPGILPTRLLLTTIAACLLWLAAGCISPSARQPVLSLSDLDPDQVLVVGRLELVPPLDEDETGFKSSIWKRYNNKAFVIIDDHAREITGEPTLWDYSGRIEAQLGKTFMVRSDERPFYILGSMIMLKAGKTSGEQVYLPGGFKVDIQPGDQAIYIGTIQYYRNEFFDIDKVVIRDEYNQASLEMKKQLGSSRPLKKRLVTLLK
ncbi:MAG: hypothetical protein L0Y56_17740 [Nitrospira sp.]|nr:hypothetical protein [Nitrospira sp.]